MKKIFDVLLLLALAFQAVAQEVTDQQWEAANAAIEADATYLIYTLNDGTSEGSTRYYLSDDGWLVASQAAAGHFKFRRVEGDGLFRSPGWQFDQYFTNPDCGGGLTEYMYHEGHIRTNASLARDNYEGQVWYKQGDVYAVRCTNAQSAPESWGATCFWTVAGDITGDGLPNADYSLTPQFIWRLEKIADAPDPVDPSIKDVCRLTNLPHVYLETFNRRAITSKTQYVLARLWYVDEQDSVAFYDSLQVRGRGNSTWGLAKKPYKLKFKQKEKFLGKGYAKTKKWTLLANHGDKTLIRNAVTMAMGERAGLKFNPAAKFVDLTLNDQYVGNYQISDQIDVRAHRVDIAEQDFPLPDGADITGGYLFEADGSGDFHTYDYWDNDAQAYLPPDGFHTSYGIPVRIHYPDADELDQRQVDYARSFIADFENRLFSDAYDDPEDGYRAYVDSASLANWYLCTEMSGNVDGMYSTYFYKDQQDNHIFWGPLWDYDIAYNNDNRTNRWEGSSDTERQLMRNASYGNVKSWVQRMWSDPWFVSLVEQRYGELIDGGMEDYLYDCIDSLTTLIDASQQLNYERWGIRTGTLRERVLYSTYGEYVRDLKDYIHNHLSFLSEEFNYKASPDPDPDPDPAPDPQPIIPNFPADSLLYYAISNVGTSTYFDVDLETNAIVCNGRNEEAVSQQWRIYPLANGYHYIINVLTNTALNDPTEGEPTATTLVGTQFNLVEGDSLDVRQQWHIVAQDGEIFNLINRFSEHAANLSGGNAADGTPVLSYTSNERDAVSNNRLWRIEEVGQVPEPDPEPEPEPDPDPEPEPEPDPNPEPEPDGISVADIDYALAYDPLSARLHFGADDLSQLAFTAKVYDGNGRLLRSFRASEGTSLSDLPHGLYIVTWTWQGRQRTVKLMRN